MFRYLPIALIVFLSFSNPGLCNCGSDNEKLLRIVSERGQAEVIIENPGRQAIDILTRNISIRNLDRDAVHLVISPSNVEWFIGQGYSYQLIERDDSKGIVHAADVSQAMEWESYPSYTQYDSIMRYFASAYPLLCRLDTIGFSIKGRLVLVLKISDNCQEDEPEPEVFYTSTMHGDETAGFILMMRLCDYLLENFDKDPAARNLVENLEIWINPLANPDGTYRSGNFINNPVRNNANDYDLNRNFPDPLAPATIRQKETIDMMKFMLKRKFVLSANFHSGVEVVNYPWDRWSRPHADDGWFISISRAWADTVHEYAPKGYMDFLDNGVTNGYDWYALYGGRQDYMTYDLSGREISVELDSDYVTPVSELTPLWEYNYRSFLGYLANALFGIHGIVQDKITGDPVGAMIFVEGHDKDHSQVYADTLTGCFTRLISPGIYDLKITAENYRDTTIKGVQVIQGAVTNLLVKMEPDLNPPDTTDRIDPLFYPNPGTDFIKVVLPEDMKGGKVRIRIFSMTGMIVSDYETETSDVFPVILDVSSLSPGVYTAVFESSARGFSCRGRFVKAGR